ncbi:MAG: hypothetical protein JST83_03110 [Bacteroidetes bacterium]|nr:hypothetical protein [Bacteroidota bacterium]
MILTITDVITNILENKLIELLTLFLWGIYVWFTIRTFNQIKRQTELQSRAFLVVTFSEETIPSGHIFNQDSFSRHQKWQQILGGHLPTVGCTPQALKLKFTNRGKSDIIDWQINVSVKIESGDYLRNHRNTDGDSFTFEVKSLSSDIIAPGDFKEVLLMPYGYYPSVTIKWDIKYSDIMEGSYSTTNDKNPVQLFNVLVYNYSNTPKS